MDAKEEIEITPAMLAAGTKALRECVPLDIARPVLCETDIVIAIYMAIRAQSFQNEAS